VQQLIDSCLDRSDEEGEHLEDEDDEPQKCDEVLFGEKVEIVDLTRRQSWIMTSIRFKFCNITPLQFKNAVFIEYYNDGRELDRIMCDMSGLFKGEYRYSNTVPIRKAMQDMRDLVISQFPQDQIESNINLSRLRNNVSFWKNAICPSALTAPAALLLVYASYLKIRIDVYTTKRFVGTNQDYKHMDVQLSASFNGQQNVSCVKVVCTVLLVRRIEESWQEWVLVIPRTNVGAEYWESTQGCTLRCALKHSPIRRRLDPIDVDGGWSGGNHQYHCLDSTWKLITMKEQTWEGWFLENIMELLCEPPLLRDGLPSTVDIEEAITSARGKRNMILMSEHINLTQEDLEALLDVEHCMKTSQVGWYQRLKMLLQCTALVWRKRIYCFSVKTTLNMVPSPNLFKLMTIFPRQRERAEHPINSNKWPVVNLVHYSDGTFGALVHKEDLVENNVNFGEFGDDGPVRKHDGLFDINRFKHNERKMKLRLKMGKWILSKKPDWSGVFSDELFGNFDYMLDPQSTLDRENIRFYHLHIYRSLMNQPNSWPFDDKGNDIKDFDEDLAPRDGVQLRVFNRQAKPQCGYLVKNTTYNWGWDSNETTLQLPPYFVSNFMSRKQALNDHNEKSHTQSVPMEEMVWRKSELMEQFPSEAFLHGNDSDNESEDGSDDGSEDYAINTWLRTYRYKRKEVHGSTWECITPGSCHCYVSYIDGDDDETYRDDEDNSGSSDDPDNLDDDIVSVGDDDQPARNERMVPIDTQALEYLDLNVSVNFKGDVIV